MPSVKSIVILVVVSMVGSLVVTPTVDPIPFVINWFLVGVVAGCGYWLGTRKRDK
jgi:hypothetical protein